jgi:hypothetical protein
MYVYMYVYVYVYVYVHMYREGSLAAWDMHTSLTGVSNRNAPPHRGVSGYCKCGIVILHFEKLQKAPDTSQEFMNTMQCSILYGSMSIYTSRLVIHTKNVNPIRSRFDPAEEQATKAEGGGGGSKGAPQGKDTFIP